MPLDLTRSLLVILIPGGIAVFPCILFLVLNTSATFGFEEKLGFLAQGFVFATATVAGLFCETIGTRIEVQWDKKREAEYAVSENWFEYLAKSIDPEPVGFRYISRLATFLYFELSLLIALTPFAFGTLALILARFPETVKITVPVIAITYIAASFFLYRDASTTHEFLCKTRRELNRRT